MNKVTRLLVLIFIWLSACQTVKNELIISDRQIGCGNFHLFLIGSQNDRYVHISLDAKGQVQSTGIEYDLSQDTTISVVFEQYSGDMSRFLCNDVMGTNLPERMDLSAAISGTCVVRLTTENFKLYQQGSPYQVHIALQDVRFANGILVKSFEGSIVVGWLPG